NNPNAAPGLDPDGDCQTNLFEYTAGIIPTNPLSRFLLRIEPVPGQANRKNLIFSPRLMDRIYQVKSNTGLSGPWLALGSFTTSDATDQRTVTDLDATDVRKFYHVEITKP
ncbi:hypothetical protein, partial [Bradyrhizobium sp. NBAIM08]|uniref:hypothetical protein n=1 Tax=Bradyrhizobium sp. NBAIM08 TaxID=2793815 RepID=UPI001CD2EA90